MTQAAKAFRKSPGAAVSQPDAKIKTLCNRWQKLCERFVPIHSGDSIWRYSRAARRKDPEQGWKFHISATVLNAGDILEKIAPLLAAHGVQFKALVTLQELYKMNSGLHYGYWQVGKCFTIYPATRQQAEYLAPRLHRLTREFRSPPVPFDRQYRPGSCVFYRYGAIKNMEMEGPGGVKLPAVKDPSGTLVLDDRLRPVPEWIFDPFQKNAADSGSADGDVETPLKTKYRIFNALTQRGKGGTYQALDTSVDPPRFCVVKEGRRHGEVAWSGQDGYYLVKNEFNVLTALGKIDSDAPKVFSSFEVDGNFYFVMEHLEGKSLNEMIRRRRRRLSVKQVLKFAVEMISIVDKIHQAGWIWNDCKPANLVVTGKNSLRPVDFEGSYSIEQADPFNWKTQGFSKFGSGKSLTAGEKVSDDLYAVGAVVYFLLTGKLYDPNDPPEIGKTRRNISERLQSLLTELLGGAGTEDNLTAAAVGLEFQTILRSI